MEHDCKSVSKQAAFCLQNLGIRPFTKGYLYLLFALTQLQQNTPFKNTIWELTAIYFGQKQKNILACVRREIGHAYGQEPGFSLYCRFTNPPKSDEFLRFAMTMLLSSSRDVP